MNLIPHSRRATAPGTWSGTAPKFLLIAALTLAVVAASLSRIWLPQHWLAPVVATVLFAAAAAAALCAWRYRHSPSVRLSLLDIAGFMTGIGIVLSLLIEPEEAVQFVQSMTRRD
jgi:hypothetical protein